MNASEVRIEKRVPLPTTGRTIGIATAMRKMAVGDSFALPDGIQPYGYARKFGIKITVKKQKDGYRVWRIA